MLDRLCFIEVPPHANYWLHKRIPKFHRLLNRSTPYECGREHRVKFNKDFIGKQALLKQKEVGVQKKFLQLILKDHDKYSDPWPFRGEPIFRNGKFAGIITSAAFGYSLDSQVLMGYVMDIDPATGQKRFMKDNSFVNGKDASWEVQIAGRKFQAKASTYPIALPPAAPSRMYVYKPTPTSEAKAKAKVWKDDFWYQIVVVGLYF